MDEQQDPHRPIGRQTQLIQTLDALPGGGIRCSDVDDPRLDVSLQEADGRTDQQAAGSGGGVMAQRNEQLGVVKDTSAGRINWDAALKINEVVNPGRQ